MQTKAQKSTLSRFRRTSNNKPSPSKGKKKKICCVDSLLTTTWKKRSKWKFEKEIIQWLMLKACALFHKTPRYIPIRIHKYKQERYVHYSVFDTVISFAKRKRKIPRKVG